MSSSAAAAETGSKPGGNGFRRFLLLKRGSDPGRPLDRNPLISPPPREEEEEKKKGFALRGLGCTSSAQAFAPAVRASADWQDRKRTRRRRAAVRRKERRAAAAADVWCAPGIGLAAADAPLDCVVAHHPAAGRGRPDAQRPRRDQSSGARRAVNQEIVSSFMDSPPNVDVPPFGSDILPSGHLRRMRGYRRSPGGLEEIMLFQTRMILGGMDLSDRYQDLRLDVDNMTYEELLELGDRIGYVSTGLREEEIIRILRKMKRSIFDATSLRFAAERDLKCSICQEEYEVNDEVGTIDCGHNYHVYCIKQWLLRKNVCPVCKTAVKS